MSASVPIMNGALIIDKPEGFTSHDVVAKLRGILKTKKIGHTGTLDPFATGVLVILVGKATRLARFLDKDEKSYEAVLRFGYETDTGDRTGKAKGKIEKVKVTRKELERVLPEFLGEIEQIPPMYSAKKVKGKKLYELARKGIEIERKPLKVRISEIDLAGGIPQGHEDAKDEPQAETRPRGSVQSVPKEPVAGSKPPASVGGSGLESENHPYAKASPILEKERRQSEFRIRISCSAGTYIRVLAEDIGRKLGAACHLGELRRTKAGRFDISRAISLEDLEKKVLANELDEVLISMNEALAHLPEIGLSDEDVKKVSHGGKIFGFEKVVEDGKLPIRLSDSREKLIAVGYFDREEKAIKPRIVMV